MNASRFSSRSSRSGFSLIEVILATAILMGSVIVLARLAGMGREQAHKAALHTTAQQLCENTMNELLLGLRTLELIDAQPLLPAESEQPSELEDLAAAEERFGGEDQFSESRDTLYGEENQEQESEWLYSVRLEPVDLMSSISTTQTQNVDESVTENDGLQKLTVSVKQSDEELLRPVRFSLTRWIRTSEMGSSDEFDSSFGLESTGGFR